MRRELEHDLAVKELNELMGDVRWLLKYATKKVSAIYGKDIGELPMARQAEVLDEVTRYEQRLKMYLESIYTPVEQAEQD